MKTYILKKELRINRPIEEVFKFFESPENLEQITPASVGFTILTPKPIKMMTGAILDYTIKLMGIKIRWTTLITDYEPPYRFCDTAIRGPYSFWHHTHRFEKDGDSTIMYDEVHYALPFGIIGRIARALWVKNQLNNIFNYRARILKDIFDKPLNKEQYSFNHK